MSKRTQKESGEERVTAKVEANDESDCKGSLNSVIFDVRKPRGRKVMKVRVPGVQILRNMIERGHPVSGRDRSHAPKAPPQAISLKARTQHATQGGTMTKPWSSQEWKADKSMDDRTGQPVVASWARTHEFQSRFSHEKTKHVILEEEETHDRTGTPVFCPQRGARPQQFIIGRRRNRIGIVVRIQIILEQGGMIKCEKDKNDLRWMLQKMEKNILWYGERSCL